MIKLLLSEPTGQIMACNMLIALEENHLEKSTLSQYLKLCYLAYEKDVRYQKHNYLIGLFENIAYGQDDNDFDFLFQCTKPTALFKKGCKVSTVITYDQFMRRLFDGDHWKHRFGYAPPGNSDCNSPAMKRLLAAPEKMSVCCPLLKGQTIGPPGSLFWVTISSELDIKLSNESKGNLGCCTRDHLGLVHRKKDQILVELKIKADKILKKKNARPTFADAGTHRRFKAKPSQKKNRKRIDWGCTVHLKKFHENKLKIDGLSERIVESLPVDEIGKVDVRLLGIIKAKREQEDARYAGHLMAEYGLSIDKLLTKLNRLL